MILLHAKYTYFFILLDMPRRISEWESSRFADLLIACCFCYEDLMSGKYITKSVVKIICSHMQRKSSAKTVEWYRNYLKRRDELQMVNCLFKQIFAINYIF